jgi:outer membrane protein OmpA-like peptidoglycan-associated protein
MNLKEPPRTGEQDLSTQPKSSGSNKLLWGVAVLAVVLAVAGALFLMIQINRLANQMTRLSGQVGQTNQALQRVTQKANAAIRQASQAETSAQQAAQQRDQAETSALKAAQQRDQAQTAEAQSQQAAAQAREQAKVAQSQAAMAQKAALQYRQQREQELNRLQQVLGQIADTRRTAMGLIMTLGSNSIRFDFDKANLRPENREILSRIAGILLTLRGYKISVFGYTDDIGTQAYNLQLSQRRAETVRDYLVKAGLNPNIIMAKGYGKSDPRMPGNTPAARAANRRVEIAIVDSSLQVQGVVNSEK